MHRPSVLLITRSLQPSHGGMQRYSRLLISALGARQDISLSVVGYGGKPRGLPWFFLRALLACLVFRGDRVHLGDGVLSPLLPVIRFLRPHLRRSITVFGLDLLYPLPAYQRMLRRCLPFAQQVVAISRATASEAVRRGVSRTKVRVIPCGIELPMSARSSADLPDSARPILLLLGRQIPRKGSKWFLSEVFPRVLCAFPGARLLIAGEGSELPAIRAKILTLDLRSAVSVLGEVTEEQRLDLLLHSSLFLMPNLPTAGDMEGFGLVCIEAAAHGVPTVGARIEGIADAILPEETGILFPPGDALAAADSVCAALSRQWDLKSIHAACRRQFSIDLVASLYLKHVFF